MKKLKSHFLLFICLIFAYISAFAVKHNSFGDIAKNIHEPLDHVAHLIRIICLVAGTGLVVGALVRFKQYRQNPIQTPLSGVIALLLAGLAVLSIVLIPIPGA